MQMSSGQFTLSTRIMSTVLDNARKHWQSEFKGGMYSFSIVIDSYHGWAFSLFNFRVELNLSLIEARPKANNQPINTLSGLVHAEERLTNLWTIDHAAMTVWYSPCS